MSSKLHFPDQPQSSPIHPPIPIVYEKQKLIWEYKQVICNLAKEKAPSEEEMNRFGAEGWELAGIFTDSMLAFFYFKRLREGK